MISASWSLQRADHGEQPYWAVILLAAALGQIGLPGGGFGFGYGSAAGIADAPLAFGPPGDGGAGQSARPAPSRPRASPIACSIRASATTTTARAATYPDIRLVYWAGGNPFHHHQDINRLRRAWQRPETIIVHEPWWTATARHADIVLPATTTLERNDIGASHRDAFVVAMQQAIAPVGEAQKRLCDLHASSRAGSAARRPTPKGRDEMEWLRHLYGRWRDKLRTNQAAIPDFDGFWNDGLLEIPAPRRRVRHARAISAPIRRARSWRRRPAGSSFIPSASRASATTIVRRIRPGSSRRNGSARASAAYPLHLVSSQPRYRLHSQMDCGPVSARGKVAGREAIAINPADAASARHRGRRRGAPVQRAAAPASPARTVTDAVAPGVVRLSCGAWYDPSTGAKAQSARTATPMCSPATRHVEARAGPDLGNGAGRDRALA